MKRAKMLTMKRRKKMIASIKFTKPIAKTATKPAKHAKIVKPVNTHHRAPPPLPQQSTMTIPTTTLTTIPTKEWFAQLSPIFVISIRERRWLDMARILHPLKQHLVHWRGTDGRTLNLEQWKRQGKIGGPRTYKRGQVGCYDSHRRVWQHIVNHKLPYALILEDDAGLTCHPAMLEKVRRVLDDVNKHDPRWELLYLARSRLRQPIVRKLTSNLAIPKYKSWGCFAYAVSQSGARKLLAHSEPMKHTLDAYVSMIGSRHLRTYTAYPSLFYVRSYRSDTANII